MRWAVNCWGMLTVYVFFWLYVSVLSTTPLLLIISQDNSLWFQATPTLCFQEAVFCPVPCRPSAAHDWWVCSRRPPAPLGWHKIMSAHTGFTWTCLIVMQCLALAPLGQMEPSNSGGGGAGTPNQSWKLPAIFSTYMTTFSHINQLSRCHKSRSSLTGWARWCIMFMVLHTLGWLFLPLSRTHKHTRMQEDIVIKCPDGCVPVAEVVCALWLLTDVGAAFRKHCSQTECGPSIRQITSLPPPVPSHLSPKYCILTMGFGCLMFRGGKNHVRRPKVFSHFFISFHF